MSEPKVVRLDRSMSRQARSLLYHCYRHEPTYQYLLNSRRPGYKQRIRATIRELIKLHFSRNEVVLGVVDPHKDRLLGIAFLSDIELKMDISDQFMWRLKMFLTTGYECTRRFLQYIGDVQAAIPDQNHRMVTLIGVHPDYQRQGLGRLLMTAVHEISEQDQESIGVFLDTGNNRYCHFYESMGYETYASVKVGEIDEAVFFRPNQADSEENAVA